MRILITDDDFLTRGILKSFLSSYGICDTAVDGYEAIQAFEFAWEEKEPYDLICLDFLMPKMDGIEVIKEIRRIEDKVEISGSKVKIIFISALGDISSIKLTLEKECEAILPKPIEKIKLVETLEKLQFIES
jgi:two-component system chemotaxis response regulator CheY